MISIHALRVEGDFDSIRHLLTPSISIHALRVEGDSRMLSASGVTTDFYPRPPGGGRLANENCQPKTPVYFYPRPPGGGRQANPPRWGHASGISIHALRVEGDFVGGK